MSNIQKYHVSKNLLYSSRTQTVGSILTVQQTIGSSDFIFNKSVSVSDTSANVDVDITLNAGTYTLSVVGLNLFNTDYDRIFMRRDDSTIVVQNVQTNRPRNFTLNETTHINRLTIVADSQSTYDNATINIMLNEGASPLPYDPYSADVWHDLSPQIRENGVFIDTTNNPEKYQNDSWG